MRKILVMAAIVGFGTSAFAQKGGSGVYLGLGFGPMAELTDKDGDKAKGSSMALDLGYTMASGLYLGAKYGTMSLKTDDDAAAKLDPNMMGLAIGYARGGFRGTFNYLVGTEVAYDGGKMTGGSGMGVSLGYLWMINGTVGLGVNLDYYTLKYTKVVDDTLGEGDLTDAATYTAMSPGLMVGFSF